MKEFNVFRKEFNVFFIASIKDNIENAKKHTSDKRIHQYLEYIYNIARGGKRLRPFVISMVASDHNQAINKDLLLGVEYLHLFAIIHDDVVDQAILRHGVPTMQLFLQEKFGLSKDQAIHQAILIGDLVFNWAYQYILKASIHNTSLGLAYGNLVSELAIGQMLDTDLPRRSRLSEPLLVEKNRIKSGRYTFARPMLFGALECNIGTERIKQYFDVGEKIGELFQLVDDEIDVTSRSVILGKKTFHDFNQKQHTYFAFYLLNKSSKKYSDIFKSKIWGKAIAEDDFEWVQEFLKESGAFAYVEAIKKTLLVEIQKLIASIEIHPDKKTKWYELTNLIYRRKK